MGSRPFQQDILYALRGWRRAPISTLFAFLTLSLGVGATTGLFSVVNGLLLRPLPVRNPNRVVRIFSVESHSDRATVSMPDALDWKGRLRSVEALALYTSSTSNMTGDSEPRRVSTLLCDADIFRVLGASVLRGRNFVSQDNLTGDSQAVILSWAFWQSQFGGRDVIGHSFRLDEQIHLIVGVLPAEMDVLDRRADLWLPLPLDLRNPQNARGVHAYDVVGLLRPGVSLTQANVELSRVSAQLASQFPQENEGIGAVAITLRQSVSGSLRIPLMLLLGSVFCVLLIACGNVANLLLAKSTERIREISVRVAIGASRVRIFRQVMTESALLAASCTVAGIAIAVAIVSYVRHLPHSVLARTENIVLDWRVLLFALGLSAITAMLFGLVPALRAAGIDINEAMKQAGGRVSEPKRQQRLRRFFIAFETGLATLLLVQSSLLIRSFENIRNFDPGFSARNLFTTYLSLPASRYANNAALESTLANQILDGVRAIPGVESAAFASDIPLYSGLAGGSILVEGQVASGSAAKNPLASITAITSDYCRTLKIPILAGRDLTRTDDSGAGQSALINQTFAKRFFPHSNPIGRRVTDLANESRPFTVVGVTGDVVQRDFGSPVQPQLFISFGHSPQLWPGLIVRTVTDPVHFARAIESEVHRADPQVPLFLTRTMDKITEDKLGSRALQTLVLTVFALLALVLSCIGVYAVVAYSVNQRTSEIGLRMAIGATQGDILRLLVRQGISPVVLGMFLGIITSVGAARLFAGFLFGITLSEPSIYLPSIAILMTIAVAACYFPARRAACIDPLKALHYE